VKEFNLTTKSACALGAVLLAFFFGAINHNTSTAAPQTAAGTAARTPPPRRFSDTRLLAWANSDADYAWNRERIKAGSDHRFNWFEIGAKMYDAEDAFHATHELYETDAKTYDRYFREEFKSKARDYERQFEP
jgi:hypothetical protein